MAELVDDDEEPQRDDERSRGGEQIHVLCPEEDKLRSLHELDVPGDAARCASRKAARMRTPAPRDRPRARRPASRSAPALASCEHGLDELRNLGEGDAGRRGTASTATSFAALSTAGRTRRRRAPRRPARRHGKRPASGASKWSAPMRARSRKSTPASMRSGNAERVRDRRAHVGIAQLRDHRSVDVLDERVDDAFRMDHDFDPVGMRVEEPARLDHLQTLVHHRRRIHRNLAPHDPVRMRARRLAASRARARAAA